jgi:hypothetical protein
MKRHYFLLWLIVSMVFCVGLTTAKADVGPTITLERPAHFTAPDGSDVQLPATSYRIEQAGESSLRLLKGGTPPIEIQATKIVHDESVMSPTAVAVMEEGQDDTVHLLLVLPGGQALDAAGSFSGARSRGTFSPMLTTLQVQHAVSQARVASQPAPQQSAPGSSVTIIRVPAGVGTVKPPSSVKLGPGKWINWTYLQVNSPEIVAQALADVQAGKRPRSFIAGLGTPAELNEMLKTNWAAEVARLNAAKQAPVTTRGLPPVVTASPSVLARPLPALPVQDLGATYSGEHHTRTFHVTAVEDGHLTAELNISDVRGKRFRIDKAVAYTGEFILGTAQVYRMASGGDFEDIRSKNSSDPTKVSMAGYVLLDVKAGQRVEVTVAFEPHASIGPPVGSYDTTLQLNWHRPDTTVAAYQTVPLRAYCNGIHFGLIAYAEQAYAITLTDQSVDYPIVLTNSGTTPISGTFSAPQLPPGVKMNPLSMNIPPNSTQRATLRFNVIGQSAQDGPNQDMAVAFNYGGQSRPINLSISIYHPWLWWCTSMDTGACGQTAGVPGLDLGQTFAGLYYFGLGGGASFKQVQVWIKTDGQWWWKIDTFNNKTVDVGGSDFNVVLAFTANPLVTDTFNVHIGPSTENQYYERLNLHPWISSNFLTAAQTGVTLDQR